MESIQNQDKIETLSACWNEIGVFGNHTCPKLKEAVHCYNCNVYTDKGRSLFNRETSSDYLEEWTKDLSEALVETKTSSLAVTDQAVNVMIFRVENELVGMLVKFFQEVTIPTSIHRVPHRTHASFVGLANIRGETLLVISLQSLMNIGVDSNRTSDLKRFIVIGNAENRWVLSVDEVLGMYRFHPSAIKDAPVVITKSSESYTNMVINWEGKKVNLLDGDLLISNLSLKIN